MYRIIIMPKEAVLLSISVDFLSEEELSKKKMNVRVNFCDNSKLIKNSYLCCNDNNKNYCIIENTKVSVGKAIKW